jgi:IS30 family transposase
MERESLYELRKQGKSNTEIAKILGRHRSSIGRELKRNAASGATYSPVAATVSYVIRRRKCRKNLIFMVRKHLIAYVCERLKKGHSPECIAGRYNKEGHADRLNFTTIYHAIKRGLLNGITAKEHLRRRGKRKFGNRHRFNTIQPDHTIHERPESANRRNRLGDWEGDTVTGAKGSKSCVFTAVDRKSRLLVAKLSPSHRADDVLSAATQALEQTTCLSLTLDNGSEFAKHRELAARLDTKVFFADPHSPWQRGTNENTNGLLRFFFPKGTNFDSISADDLDSVVSLLNDRPRKCLNWLSPREVFFNKAFS